MQQRIITLTTDFGLMDEYVAVMKGVIYSINPKAIIVDISHAISPQNITAAALMISAAYLYFPKNTIHVIVVDPGVGSKRDILILSMDDHIFVAPDNGVLTPLLLSDAPKNLFKAENTSYFRPNPSSTFHGRDIFAPVSAHLSLGVPHDKIGQLKTDAPPVIHPLSKPIIDLHGTLEGCIVYCDHFGNIITNIGSSDLEKYMDEAEYRKAVITVNGNEILGIRNTYSDGKPGDFMALINSRGFLEIALPYGDAAKKLMVADKCFVRIIKRA